MVAPEGRVLFTGDSITDTGRRRDVDGDMEYGYAGMAAALHRARHPERGVTFGNAGVAGRRVRDLRAHWDEECVGWRPDVVSILVGVNDTLLVRADALFAERVGVTGPAYWCRDGVHPTPAGHALLAEEWPRVVAGG